MLSTITEREFLLCFLLGATTLCVLIWLGTRFGWVTVKSMSSHTITENRVTRDMTKEEKERMDAAFNEMNEALDKVGKACDKFNRVVRK